MQNMQEHFSARPDFPQNPCSTDFSRLIGFATVYFNFSSTMISKVAVMNDLYTAEDCRGHGVGSALVKYCASYGKSKGAVRLQWVTAPDNKVAQAVYKSVGT